MVGAGRGHVLKGLDAGRRVGLLGQGRTWHDKKGEGLIRENTCEGTWMGFRLLCGKYRGYEVQ